MSLLEDKYIDINSIVDCEGGVKYFYGLRIKDSHLGTGAISVKDAFARSSNVAFAKLAEQYYHNQPSKFIDHLHHMHLDTLSGIDITASSGYPVIKKATARSWSATTIPFMAHGYEELVTPINMLTLYNAVANNGKMMRPYLVSSVREYGVESRAIHPQVLEERVCSNETLAQLKECLRAVVDSAHGTGHKVLYNTVYSISGKTGTAVTALDNKGYNKGNKIYQASFIGYFPSESPKYTIAVVIQNSNESKLIYGADVSGTVFKEISDRIYNRYISTSSLTTALVTDTLAYKYYGNNTDLRSIVSFFNISTTDSAQTGYWKKMDLKNNAAALSAASNAVTTGPVTPDVTGMGLKDAVYLLENKGFKTLITGRGRVLTQSVAAGSAFVKGQKILLALN